MKFELAIIGGGPAGYVAAERAAKKGLSVVLFEKNELGGVCLNEGCIPTKTLLYSAKLYEHATRSAKYGVTAEGVVCDFGKMAGRKTKVVRKLTAAVGLRMKEAGVTVVKGEARIVGGDATQVTIQCGTDSYEAKKLLLCTGSQTFIPPIEGLAAAGEAVVTHRELLALKELPASLVVIGGGVIGMEFASLFNTLGCRVSVVEMLPQILGGLDGEVSAMLRDIYAKKGIDFHLSCRVTSVSGHAVNFTDSEGAEHTVEGEKILVSVGRRPVTAGFGLEKLNLEMNRAGVKVDATMQTSLPNVYAAGDITGFSLLAHTASCEAEVAVDNLCGARREMSYRAIPGIVYTNPEVAGTGLTEEQAQAAGIEYGVMRLPMAYSGRFVAENEGGNGLCKLIYDKKQRTLIGAHLLGNPCSEIIWGLCMAIEQNLALDAVHQVVFPHPTVGEIVKECIAAAHE